MAFLLLVYYYENYCSATSANIGPGFDSVGVAVSKYLTIRCLNQQMHGISDTI